MMEEVGGNPSRCDNCIAFEHCESCCEACSEPCKEKCPMDCGALDPEPEYDEVITFDPGNEDLDPDLMRDHENGGP